MFLTNFLHLNSYLVTFLLSTICRAQLLCLFLLSLLLWNSKHTVSWHRACSWTLIACFNFEREKIDCNYYYCYFVKQSDVEKYVLLLLKICNIYTINVKFSLLFSHNQSAIPRNIFNFSSGLWFLNQENITAFYVKPRNSAHFSLFFS